MSINIPQTGQIESMNKRNYHIINISFGCIILSIIIYSLLFKNSHPVPALLTDITGIIPPSKGLSASFSLLVRGNIDMALAINPYSLRIFSFFIIQLFTRALVSLAVEGNWLKPSRIILVDVIYSSTLFIICFAPLITYTFSLFTKLL